MKFAHLGDLHLGKNFSSYSLIEDQKYILNEIVNILKEEQADAVLIAGDVYDRSVPSAEAVLLLDDFLSVLEHEGIEVYMIAGNHDSGDRLSYGAGLLERMHIHITGNYTGSAAKYVYTDDYGEVNIYAVPFIRPSYVNRYITDEKEKVSDYTEAMRYIAEHAGIDPEKRNIIMSHQFVTGASADISGSEELIVGGLDQISASVYDIFDYTALGHIHRPQKIGGKENIRYSGTPLKYSFAEKDQIKSIPVIELKEKGSVSVSLHPLKPLHEVREIRGMFEEIRHSAPDPFAKYDYVHFVLEDEEMIPNAMRDLQAVYPMAVSLEYASVHAALPDEISGVSEDLMRTPLEVFSEFYKLRTDGKEMSEEQRNYIAELIGKIWNEEEQA